MVMSAALNSSTMHINISHCIVTGCNQVHPSRAHTHDHASDTKSQTSLTGYIHSSLSQSLHNYNFFNQLLHTQVKKENKEHKTVEQKYILVQGKNPRTARIHT